MGGHHHHHAHDHLRERSRETQRVTLVGAGVNLLLAVVKTIVGISAQSAALVADGIHSFSDLMSDALVWLASRHAAEGPDEQHPYGHGRFETAATLGLGILLMLIALGIVWEALERTWAGEHLIPDSMALWAAGFSILANEGLYWYTLAAARRVKSDMLRANAWHHRSDAVSSIVVLIGVGGAMLGWPYLDALAAIIVGVMVAKIGWELGWGAMEELVDTALDKDSIARARAVILAIDGVTSIHMLRTRRHGPEAAADVHVQVKPRLSVSEGHMISQMVEDLLKEEVDAITDVTVHVDPENDEGGPPCRGLPLRPDVKVMLDRAWADAEGLPDDYQLVLHYLSGRIDIELILPLSEFGGNLDASRALQRRLSERLQPYAQFGSVELKYQ